ncbi:hypothetical protein BST22_20730 [Mycolicibacterium chubuense]|jgi:hypothetical protein|uniref:34 kDa antigenic protein n=1 Tax=Mycolicibacterium chubuense TaxID=1800 RepID=A0A0J6YMM8_MYCCU|nr:DUF5336 domain-containing protein [Mycolicibacterium chubuense]KMO73991.1 hypothetical protein MCHUDSM44219_04046 [Mycolicibacterium chubuense]ORA47031.1 hypothetical protein BST22_20730 [Mycolicibacterium chubuense]SPX97791.1 transmembrane protein [Mycolicibacterium chubuense]
MSYPQGAPGGSGYPPAQQPTTQFSAPTQQFAKIGESDPAAGGPSKLPGYLSAAVAALGLLVYLSYFAPQFTVTSSDFPGLGELSGSSVGLGFAVIAAVVAALFAGVGLLPRQRNYVAVAAVASVLGFLLVISEVINKPSGTTVDWGLYLLIAFTLLQAAVAVVVLLFDSGVITPPVPRPKYEQPQYGQYPGSYYGQHPGQPQHGGQGGGQQQRPGYPTPYGGYPSAGPSTGGFPAASPSSGGQPGAQSGPPTPPTGYPTYGQPPSSNAPTTQVPTQHQSSPTTSPGQSS